jgi:hypothetical protein
MKQKHRSIAVILFILSFLFSGSYTSGLVGGVDTQQTIRLSVFDFTTENDYIYIVGSAINYAGSLPPGSLNLSSGMKDIYVLKMQKDGTPVFQALIGGSNDDEAYGVVVRQGVVYVLGETWSDDFPGAPGNAGESDVIMFALAADGSQILWSRRLGGSDQDAGRALKLQNDSLYLTGITWSQNLVQGAAKGDADGFLARVDLSGDLKWLQVFGGRALDAPFDLAVSGQAVWVTGQTFSNNFGTGTKGGGDIFAARFGLDGNQQFVGLYGGREEDIGFGITLGNDNSLYLSGATQSSGLPGAMGSFSGRIDALLMRISPTGELLASTYLGGSEIDYAYAGEMLPNEHILITGMTGSPQFPLGSDSGANSLGGNDAFLAQLNADGQVVSVWLIGSSADDRATDFIVMEDGVWLMGNFPEGRLPYADFVPAEDLTNLVLPTNPPPLPTATMGFTATPQPTETPIPTLTATMEPGVEIPSVTATQSPLLTESVLDETEEMTQDSNTQQSATELPAGDQKSAATAVPISSPAEENNGVNTFILVLVGLVIALAVIGIFFWNKSKRTLH